MKKTIIIISMLLITASKLYAALLFDPQLEWRSIQTKHFWIHYHQGIEVEAVKLSVIAEKVHERLSPLIQWQPKLRTDVVLVDNFYTANGSATPFPFNRIEIYLTRPELDSVLNNFDSWLEMVFTHEYTHILNLDTVYGFPAITRYAFGRCCFPNMYLPTWMLEGNAVYHESDYSKFGRNNSTYTDMVMRTEILYKNFKPISDASNYPREWPIGNVPYLYGGLFVDYLEKKYGKGRFENVMTNNSYNILPYSDNVHYSLLLIFPFFTHTPWFWYSASEWEYGEGQTSRILWKEWEEFIKIKYDRQIENIKNRQLTSYKKITYSGYLTTIPRWSRNGKDIYYIRNTNYDKSALIKHSLETGDYKILCKVNDPNSLSVSGNGRIFVSDAEYYRSFSIFNEAFVYDYSYRKLTSKLKGSYIDASPDGAKICFVKQDAGRFSLILADQSFNNFESIIDRSDIQIAFPRFSPDGKKIVFTLKEKNGNTDLAVLDIAGRNMQRLTNDDYNDIHATWHPDGDKIIFVSDRDKVYNLFEYDLKNKAIYKITNVLGGAFSPDVSPDGSRIVFSCYEKNGFDIAVADYPQKTSKPENADIKNLPAEFFGSAEQSVLNNQISTEKYNVFNSLIPAFWYPVFGNYEVYHGKYEYVLGGSTLGWDTLYKNMYLLTAYAYTYEKRANIDAYYLFGYLYPDIILQYHDDTLFFGEDKFPWEDKNTRPLKREMERSGIAGIAFPFYYYLSYHVISFSYKYEKSITDRYEPPNTVFNYKDIEARVRAKYMYSNALEYSYSISKEDGRDFFIAYDAYRKEIGSDFTYSKVMGEYAEYLPGIGRNNVIMPRIRGGASFGNPDHKSPYPIGRFQKGDITSPATDEDEFGLRGYPYGGIFGNRIAVGALEYRFPVLQKDFGLGTFPLMFRDLWLTLFAEYGNVWNNEINTCDFKKSAGIELNLRITLGYYINLQGYIGFARGFDKYGEDQVYFAISTLFEGALKNNYKWLDYL
ncbi:MAG: BamA/TamA family outer membrane protein [Spirochaetota bacterium]